MLGNLQFSLSGLATQDQSLLPSTQASSMSSQQFDLFDFGSQSQSTADFNDSRSEAGSLFEDEDILPKSSDKSRQLGKAPRSRGMFLPLQETVETVVPTASVPEDSCAYCSLSEPSCLVQCDCCRKWFCNARLGSSGSHIVNHLVRSKHKEINLHSSSPLGDTILECYSCGCKNIFLLGFVPAKGENIVVLLCREPCLSRTKNPEWSLDRWMPLISDKMLLPWIVRPPTVTELENTSVHLLSAAQANALEQLWMTRSYATLEDLHKIQSGAVDQGDLLLNDLELKKVSLSYKDGRQYDTTFTPLVKLEAENDKKVKESQSSTGISIRWEICPNNPKRKLACFVFPSFSAESELRLVAGDEVKLRYPGDTKHAPWSCIGHVLRFNQNDEIVVELKPGASSNTAPIDVSFGYSADFVWKSTSFDRMERALTKFSRDTKALSPELKGMLLGKNFQSEPILNTNSLPSLNAPGLAELNPSQQQAVKAVLSSSQPISMIQGPPGTGKTTVCGHLIYHLVQHLKKFPQKNTYIMVCAPSNVAADQLAEKIHATGVKVVRIFAKSRESVFSSVEHLALHNVIMQVEAERSKNGKPTVLTQLTQQRFELGELSPADEHRYMQLRLSAEREVLRNTHVFVTTCVGTGDPRLKSFRFKYVLVDEATAATEPECLIPLVYGATKVMLVGDHCQLGPVVMCKEAAQAGLSQSLFERLVLLGHRPFRLQIQYRMHPILAEFPSDTFYEGTLQNGVTAEDRKQPGDHGAFPWVDPSLPLFFSVCTGSEELSASGTSYLNRTEASFVEKVVTEFLKTGVSPDQIGVVTPYEGQRAFITCHMQRNGPLHSNLYRDVEVASVDSFQGREKDYIILSCVRSNDHSSIGFLNDPRRLNVALTRAKYGLVIVGNPRVLSRHVLWNNLLSWFKSIGCFVEGPLNNLRKSNISFPKPKAFVMDKRFIPSALANELNIKADPVPKKEGTPSQPPQNPPHKWALSFTVPSASAVPSLSNVFFESASTDLFDLGHSFLTQDSQSFTQSND
ncbi:hypothetical protein RCL1_004345 [Eukaryota sp. TZLM3-RCL]